MNFEELLLELIANLTPVVIEEEEGESDPYFQANEKAMKVLEKVTQWQFDAVDEPGVFYACKYQEGAEYVHGPFNTLSTALNNVNPDTGLMLYRFNTGVVVEPGDPYFCEKIYVGGGKEWVKSEL